MRTKEKKITDFQIDSLCSNLAITVAALSVYHDRAALTLGCNEDGQITITSDCLAFSQEPDGEIVATRKVA